MFKKILIVLQQWFSFLGKQDKKISLKNIEKQPLEQATHTYSMSLIPQLKSEHKKLVEIYVGIQSLFESKKYQQVVEQLLYFKEEFSLHLIEENVKFYAYLESNLEPESVQLQTIKTYRKDMNQIAHVVVKFLKKWTAQSSLNPVTADDFLQEYESIGAALVQRITDEEQHLYTLYHPLSFT